MASELQTDYLSGKTIYFLLRSSVGTIWNGAALASYLSANYSQYPITATEQGSSGYYVANMPAVAAGFYNILAKVQAGASPAETDITVGTGQIDWSGSVVETLSFLPISGTAQPAVSGVFAFASLNSGQSVLVYSGQLSGQPVNPLSGVTVPQSGLTFIASGPFVVANISGQSTIAASGLYVTVPKETLSGIVPASGAYTFASLNSGTLSGQPMDKAVLSGLSAIAILYSGQQTIPYSGSLSGQKVELFSGNIVAELSGAYVIASLLSGQQVSVYSGQLSGQPTSPNSGVYGIVPPATLSGMYTNASLLSGNSVLLYSGMLSGQPMSVAFNQDKSGYSLAPAGLDTITVESGMNFRQAQAIIAAGNGGQLSGVGTGTIRIGAANVSGGPIRITGTVTSGGNRTIVTLNLPS